MIKYKHQPKGGIFVMKLTFIGAAHEVTGSCFLLEAAGKKILIDCGLEQGRDLYENSDLPIAPGEIDCLLLTHAHIDHSGRIPLLVAGGFTGPVFTTEATASLCSIMLLDSAHIQEFEAEWKSRKAKRAGKPPVEPLYTTKDAQAAIELLTPCRYNAVCEVAPGVTAQFTDVGHLLGSASVHITVQEEEETRTLLFTGDIGNVNKPILRDPQTPPGADYLIIESTYAGRTHGPEPDYVGELSAIIQRTLDRGGNLVIPSFAVGRTQEILYFLRAIKQNGLIKGHDGFPVVVDSPLAVEATNIFTEDGMECYDEETMRLVKEGINPIGFSGLVTSISAEDSKAINADPTPKVILSASGMCEAGRIRHHLKHNLWRKENTILFVGYQAEGTLGRMLLEGAQTVKLFGETIEVRAELAQLHSISGHADDDGLKAFVKKLNPAPKRVFAVHGEDANCDLLAQSIYSELGLATNAPFSGDCWDLLGDLQLVRANPKRIAKAQAQTGQKPPSAAYLRLLSASKKLESIIAAHTGASNKDLAKFADQLLALCDKWED